MIIWNVLIFPAAHICIQSETPWIGFAKIDTVSTTSKTRNQTAKRRGRLKQSANTMFSATFRMIPPNTRETSLACLTTAPSASPESPSLQRAVNSLCLFQQEWRFHHILHPTSLPPAPTFALKSLNVTNYTDEIQTLWPNLKKPCKIQNVDRFS